MRLPFLATVAPELPLPKLPPAFDTIRYEVAIGAGSQTDGMGIVEEYAFLKQWEDPSRQPRGFFPAHVFPPSTIITPKGRRGIHRVLSKAPGGNDNFYSEVSKESGKGWFPSIKLGPHKSALGTLPEDESRFPVSTWLKKLLVEGVQKLVLNSLLIRRPSPPGQVRGFKSDGSNLPWVVADFRTRSKERFGNWIAHLQTALPDLKNIDTIEREEDKHRYLVLCYADGLRVPSWVASDGTLRLLALTLPAYLPEVQGIYLIEEPENGIHPRAIATMFQSLSSVYDAQILLASHSPVILERGGAETSAVLPKDGRRSDQHRPRERTPGTSRVARRDHLGKPAGGRRARMNQLSPQNNLVVLAADKSARWPCAASSRTPRPWRFAPSVPSSSSTQSTTPGASALPTNFGGPTCEATPTQS